MPLPPEYRDTVFRSEVPAHELPPRFAVVTACDPMGQPTGDTANELADRELRVELERRGWRHFRVTGGNADFSHAEPGWGIECGFAEALALGRHYRQLAIWWIENDALDLIDCADGSRERVASFAARLRP